MNRLWLADATADKQARQGRRCPSLKNDNGCTAEATPRHGWQRRGQGRCWQWCITVFGHRLAGKCPKSGKIAIGCSYVASGDLTHDEGWSWSQNVGLDVRELSGWSVSPKVALRQWKMPQKWRQWRETNNQKYSVDNTAINGGSWLVTDSEAVTIGLVRWLQEGRILTSSKPKWRQR